MTTTPMTTSTITYKSVSGEFDSTHNTNEVVWQIVEKSHLEEMIERSITDAEWKTFIATYADDIASEMSRCVAELFESEN